MTATKKKTTSKAKPTTKKVMGRPPKYHDKIPEQAYHLTRIGGLDVDLAEVFGVAVQTIDLWKREHPDFIKAIKDGKDQFDTDAIKGALRHRALGYSCPETKVFCVGGEIITEEVIKHYPPEVSAIVFWLKNRQPDQWRDKRHYESDDKPEDKRPAKAELESARKRIVKELETYDDED
jgi:hypothetical protein